MSTFVLLRTVAAGLLIIGITASWFGALPAIDSDESPVQALLISSLYAPLFLLPIFLVSVSTALAFWRVNKLMLALVFWAVALRGSLPLLLVLLGMSQ